MNSLILDSQMLFNLYGGSNDDVRFILNDYLDNHGDIINAFRQAFNSGTVALSQCAHRYSSSFSYIGVPQLTTACMDFEKDCKNASDTKAISSKFEVLLDVIDQSAQLVKQELNRLKRS